MSAGIWSLAKRSPENSSCNLDPDPRPPKRRLVQDIAIVVSYIEIVLNEGTGKIFLKIAGKIFLKIATVTLTVALHH